jgi:hypothetical protein
MELPGSFFEIHEEEENEKKGIIVYFSAVCF